MQKTHQSPEFTVIRQNQTNAKFFVASGFAGPQNNPPQGGPLDSASHFDDGGSLDM